MYMVPGKTQWESSAKAEQDDKEEEKELAEYADDEKERTGAWARGASVGDKE